MSESESSDGIISVAEIAELSNLFDQSEFAFDPTSDECKEAYSQLESRLRYLFEEKIEKQFAGVSFHQFRCGILSQCRLYIRKNH